MGKVTVGKVEFGPRSTEKLPDANEERRELLGEKISLSNRVTDLREAMREIHNEVRKADMGRTVGLHTLCMTVLRITTASLEGKDENNQRA